VIALERCDDGRRQFLGRLGVAEDTVLDACAQRVDDRGRAAEIHVRHPQRDDVAVLVAVPLGAAGGAAVDRGFEVEGVHSVPLKAPRCGEV
jgi:hypothetical protein